MTAEHYKDRIARLHGALQEIARGQLSAFGMASLTAQAADNDAKLSEQHRKEAGED